MSNAFNDALIHVVKHSGSDVYGFLVADKTDPTNVIGCIPLFHSRFVSTPLLRVAMTMIDQLEDLQIVAMYYASEVYGDRIPPIAKWIVQELRDVLQKADLLCLQFDEDLVKNSETWPFKAVGLNGEKKEIEINIKTTYDHSRFTQVLRNHDYATTLSDFEDHINNPANKWLRIYS